MGFRNLQLFNLALLGKHGWRLVTNPHSLCARVLKEKYFPNTDFWEASAHSHASATWRAILAGREALGVGMIKRIGDGYQKYVCSGGECFEEFFLSKVLSNIDILQL